MRFVCSFTVTALAAFAMSCGGGDSNQAPTQVSAATQGPTTEVSPALSESPSPALAPTETAVPATLEPEPGPLEVGSSDRVRIPRLGIDAPLRLQVVGTDGQMGSGDSSGVDIYDFSAFPGLGGVPGRGNTVIAGLPQPGAASFEALARLVEGDEITLTLSGEDYTYLVVILCVVLNSEAEEVLRFSSFDKLTAIQGSAGDSRLFAIAERNVGALPRECPAGIPN